MQHSYQVSRDGGMYVHDDDCAECERQHAMYASWREFFRALAFGAVLLIVFISTVALILCIGAGGVE